MLDDRRALEGQDFTYDPATRTLTVSGQARYGNLHSLYWNNDRHLFVEDYDSSRHGIQGDGTLWADNLKAFYRDFFRRHPDLQGYALEGQKGGPPAIVRV